MKRINERQETEIMDTAEVRKKGKKTGTGKGTSKRAGTKKKTSDIKRRNVMER